MNAPYDTTTGRKQDCRVTFINAVREHIPNPLSFFTLTSENAHDARLIHEAWPQASIRGVEKKTDVFNHILNHHHIIDPYKGTVGEYVRDHADMFRRGKYRYFDAAFIDYTGTAKK